MIICLGIEEEETPLQGGYKHIDLYWCLPTGREIKGGRRPQPLFREEELDERGKPPLRGQLGKIDLICVALDWPAVSVLS